MVGSEVFSFRHGRVLSTRDCSNRQRGTLKHHQSMQRGALSEIENNSVSEDVEAPTSYWSSVCRRLDGAAEDLVSVVLDFQQGLPPADFMDGDVAAQNGHLELLKAGHAKQFSTRAMDIAAANGHLEVVKWLHENRMEGCTTAAMDEACKNGHLEVVEWLHHNRQEGCTGGAMDLAASHGHLEVVKFLHNNRSEGCSTLAVDFAAHNGHTEVVKWLFENRQEGCTPAAAEGAARQGHMEIVRYLRGHKRGRSVDYKDLGDVLARHRPSPSPSLP